MPLDLSVPPSATKITLAALRDLVNLYDVVLSAFYQDKIKDAKKRKPAIETDTWRYGALPQTYISDDAKDRKDGGINQSQLERLVDWKITHGKFRPFLLPQVRKNAAETVREETSNARMTLMLDRRQNETPSNAVLKKALDAVCLLKGVGPATGTLVLSVFDPDNIPFFQDELYAWLVPAKDGSLNTSKLKYNPKEYFELVHGMRQIREKFRDGSTLKAWEIEKASFVVGNWHLVDEAHRSQVLASMHASKEQPSAQELGRSEDQRIDAVENSTQVLEKTLATDGANENKNGHEDSQGPASRRGKRTRSQSASVEKSKRARK